MKTLWNVIKWVIAAILLAAALYLIASGRAPCDPDHWAFIPF